MLSLTFILLVVGAVFSCKVHITNTAQQAAPANSTLAAAIDYASLQNQVYLQENPIPQVMTLSSGAPIKRRDAYSSLNRNLLLNENIMESLSHLSAEAIPAKIVHNKGGGASGYFEVTHDITNICKAKLFDGIGKRTPIRIRFSNSFQRVDTARDARGFSVKFYTEDGNFDIAGFNTPVFTSSDPVKFSNLVHMVQPNAASGVPDPNSLWDYVSLNEEALLLFTMLYTDLGTPASYRSIDGYSNHAYQVSNTNDEITLVRFHFLTPAIANFTAVQAATIAGQDIDYHMRELYNSIAAGNFPEWEVGIQVLTLEEARAEPRLLDVSRYLPKDRFPVLPVGKLVLDKNPNNFFAEIAQLQFLPSNIVPGIQGAPDTLYESRIYAYRLSANHRLGINYNKIPTNQPLNNAKTYLKEGSPPVLDNEGNAPSYFPNSFNGPQPVADNEPELVKLELLPPYNRDQVDEYYRNLPEDQKTALIQNLGGSVGLCLPFIQERIVSLLSEINEDYGSRLAAELLRLQQQASQ